MKLKTLRKFLKQQSLRAVTMLQPLDISQMVPGTPVLQPDRSGIAVVAIMKDEARHVQDWIRFHHLAGVDHFFLYDDGSSDGTGKLAQALGGNHVTVIPWKLSAVRREPHIRFSRQVLAYCHAIENFGGMFRWMAFIDLDEYIVPKRKSSIPEVLDGLESFTNISLPWTMFGPGDHQTPPDLPAPFAYTQRAATRTWLLLRFKCIVDPVDVTEVRVHRFCTASMQDVTVNDVGFAIRNNKRQKSTEFLSDAELQLNHYYTRSHEELHEKLTKGISSYTSLEFRKHLILRRVALIESTAQQEDLSAIAFLARRGIADPDAFRATCVDEGEHPPTGMHMLTTEVGKLYSDFQSSYKAGF